ncbi:MAG: PQQ-dependent sugar dehydrogenase [Rhodoferax sp.]|jgi:glucose/arabinose dehydrogenase|nr:PQQ-dependent sugar dehydrogenase [Rhodoferax sp.]
MKHPLLAASLFAFLPLAPAHALDSVLVGSGFEQPVFLTAPVNDPRLFIVEKSGRIQVSLNGSVSTYLDLSARVDVEGERGLLGLAFDPGFASNGRFYVNYIDSTTRNTVVSVFTAPSAAASVADANSEKIILTVAQPPGRTNHKGGWIGFSSMDPGNLYIATGDGGSGNDPDSFAQNTTSNLGKMLRVTPLAGGGYTVPANNPFVDQAGNDEIWAFGLRNPYRNSFDRGTGDLWIGDVGQDTREEINFQAVGSAGGANYGWRAREGTVDNPGVPDAPPASAIEPVFDYAHNQYGESIIGGYVYRGNAEPGLDGSYFFGDFVSGRIFTLRESGGVAGELTERTADLGNPLGAFNLSSFGEDGAGNLYAVGLNGNIYRIASAVPEPSSWALLAAGLGLLAGAAKRRARVQVVP